MGTLVLATGGPVLRPFSKAAPTIIQRERRRQGGVDRGPLRAESPPASGSGSSGARLRVEWFVADA